MYVRRPELRLPKDLNQGDILRNVHLPQPPTGENFALVENKNKIRFPFPVTELGKAELLDGVRVMMRPIRIEALVISNSCDNASGFPVFLAPIRPFRFPPPAQTPPEQSPAIPEPPTTTPN